MKLKNKKTGGLASIDELCVHTDAGWHDYTSLAELNEEWEDVPEEPKEPEHYWYIGYKNDIRRTKYHHISDFADNQVTVTRKEIGNCFGSLEEAERALEKLKAWKRLKDKGFRFIDYIDRDTGQGITRFEWNGYIDGEDLDLLFGGEE